MNKRMGGEQMLRIARSSLRQIRDFGLAAIFVAVTSGLSNPAAGQNQAPAQLSLPQVTVTAPFVPLYLRPTPGDPFNTKAYQRNPYFGNNRVEEDKFSQVPCSENRIAAVSDASCLEGYHLASGYASSMGFRNARGHGSRCEIAHDVTIYNFGDLSIEADVFVFDPYYQTGGGFPNPNCTVYGYPGYDLEDFRDMNRITRVGTDWHDFRGTTCSWQERRAECETKSVEFSYGPRKCIAIRRPGPYWNQGYIWMLTASICHTDMGPVQQGDVDRALSAVQIRQHDPGSIGRPPEPPLNRTG
jgi:hypothetical protein